MKKLLILTLGLGLLASCDSSDNPIDTTIISTNATLPAQAQEVITRLDGYTLERVNQFATASSIGSLYEGKLVAKARSTEATRLDIEFDGSGLWTDIEAENGYIPRATIASLKDFPAVIVTYIVDNSLLVEEIERKSYGFKVETTTDVEYLFDKAGLLLSQSSVGSGGDASTSTPNVGGDVASVASAFASKHFSGYSIVYSKADRDDGVTYYKYYLQRGYRDSYKLTYDTAGKLVEIEGDDNLGLFIPQSALVDFLPASAVTYIGANISKVAEAQWENGFYVVEIPTGEYVFTADGTFVSFDRD